MRVFTPIYHLRRYTDSLEVNVASTPKLCKVMQPNRAPGVITDSKYKVTSELKHIAVCTRHVPLKCKQTYQHLSFEPIHV